MMKRKSLGQFALKSIAGALALAPIIASAQVFFTDTQVGDVDIGFRKTGPFQEQYEMVAYLGNVSNFLAQARGTQITISNYSTLQLSHMCPDGFNNLQWSVFGSFFGTISNSAGVWPKSSCWYTVPRTDPNQQTTPISRIASSNAGLLQQAIISVSDGANTLSQQLSSNQGGTNANNNRLVILEPISFNPQNILTAFMGDKLNPTFGDFGGSVITFSVENTTPSSFSTASVSDFYVNVPYSSSPFQKMIDPLTGLADGVADYLGYFTLNPNGTLTFTRAPAAGSAPVAGFSGSPTTGFAPLRVAFSDSSTGSITKWIWEFGDGQSVTNTTSASVNHTYTAAGNYTVSLTVSGSGGTNTKTQTGYVVVSQTPQLGSVILSGGNVVLAGASGPPGLPYRILTSTNVALPLSSWTPVYTNTFSSNGSLGYTNSATTGGAAFFLLVSP
jgi:PKD repeat protein